MVAELLLEVGTEEIPAGYLPGALRELVELAKRELEENRIETAGGLYSYATPRRLVLIGKAISEKQEDAVHEIKGPPKSVGFDQAGNPTKAALGFAQKQGVPFEAIECINTPKGEYLYIKHRTPGRPTREVMAEVLPELISKIPWPKSMRWGDVEFSFVRPVHWVLALFGGEVVPFEVAGINAGNMSRGHRFMAPGTVEIHGVEDYFRKLEKAFVIVDQEEREHIVKAQIQEAAAKVGGEPARDEDLLTTVANLSEYPSAVCSSFDDAYLSLPEQVLITAMKEHQKYFPVYGSGGKLMPCFVAVNNTVPRDESMVIEGHERVLRARLSDANFFFKEDRKRPLVERLEDLKCVVYQADLGTSYDKVQRFTRLAKYLGEKFMPDRMEDLVAVGELCKCDLVTRMVGEFPSLQGVMGREYARLEGYPEPVCAAIYEHYLPVKAEGELPESEIGALVGIADRMDTIVGCFAVGLEASGSADPFALRRHALALIRIIEQRAWAVSLYEFIETAIAILGEGIAFDGDFVFWKVQGFIKDRYKYLLMRSGYESDFIDAVLSVEFDRLIEIRPKVEQLKRFVMDSEDFEALAITFKRVSNILRKEEESFQVNPGLFKDESESGLWDAYRAAEEVIYSAVEKGNYYEALDQMAALKGPVDEFFEKVEVLTKENESLRRNRVGILRNLAGLIQAVADFSKFPV